MLPESGSVCWCLWVVGVDDGVGGDDEEEDDEDAFVWLRFEHACVVWGEVIAKC